MSRLRRRDALAALALPALPALGLGWCAPARAAELPAPASLADALAAALARRQPLVVMASLHGCPFCRVVRDNYLAPMRAEGAVAAVQLDTGSTRAVADFAGAPATHDALLRAWKIATWPTLLFFGAGGREVAPRLVGGDNDFYSAYLDERLAGARRRVAAG